MSPDKIVEAAPLIDKLWQLEDFQLKLSLTRSVQVRYRDADGTEDCYHIKREAAVMLFQQQIDTTKAELRELGVVLPGDSDEAAPCPTCDAIMPELRGERPFSDDVDPATREADAENREQVKAALDPHPLTITITGGDREHRDWLALALKRMGDIDFRVPYSSEIVVLRPEITTGGAS